MRKYFLFFSIVFLFSFAGTSLKKRVSDTNFRYEFYTTNKVVSPQPERSYYWFKGGLIHSSEYGVAGELLHDEFLKFYHSNQLAEAGKYKNGLREGYWKTWFENGTLQSKTYYDNGQKDGTYLGYDKTGFLTESGKYKNNLKTGRWINAIAKDTLKYSEGKVITKKVKVAKVKDSVAVKSNKPGYIKRLFTKKDKKTATVTKSTKAPKVTDAPAKKKEGNFFTRLFSKKTKPATPVQSKVVAPAPAAPAVKKEDKK